MATTWRAPNSTALRIAICPTGPQPQIATVSVVLDLALHGGLPAGRENVAQEQHLFVGQSVRHLDVRGIGERYAQVFRLPARIAAGEMCIAEQPGSGVTEYLVGDMLVAIGPLADREVAAFALLALAADDGERHNDAVADLQVVGHA